MTRRIDLRRIAVTCPRRLAVALGAFALIALAAAQAAEQTRAFNIDASSPALALQSFAAQSGLQILASGTRLRGRQLNPVAGEYSADVALQQLLAGSGLGFEYVGERAVALVAIDEPAAVRAVPAVYERVGARALPAQEGEGAAGLRRRRAPKPAWRRWSSRPAR